MENRSSGFLVGGGERAGWKGGVKLEPRAAPTHPQTALRLLRWDRVVPLIPFPSYRSCSSDRPGAVKGSLRRFAPWTAPGRSERRAAYEGKGGVGPCGRAEREPFGHTRTPSRSRGALSPAGP